MAINKKLIHFNHKEDFLREKDTNNNILDTSIVFIKDTQELWTHGQFYSCLSDKFLDLLNGIYSNTYVTVDLGLPSGTLWADRNIGAVDETDKGLRFQWADIQGYTEDQIKSETNEEGKVFNYDNYKYSIPGGNNYCRKLTKYCNLSQQGYNGFQDSLTIIEPKDDAATVNMGDEWKMPTDADFLELIKNTYQRLVLSDGTEIEGGTPENNGYAEFNWGSENIGNRTVKGIKFINKTDNSKYIFIPSLEDYEGYLWSSSLYLNDCLNAWVLEFCDTYITINWEKSRSAGIPIRGISSKALGGKSLSTNDFSDELKSKLTKTISIYNSKDVYVEDSPLKLKLGDIIYQEANEYTPYPTYMYVAGITSENEVTFGNILTNETLGVYLEGFGEMLDTKVDKVEGKNLSTNDFTNEYKTKLDSITEGAAVKSVNGRTGVVTGLAEASNVYTKSEVDQKVADAVTGGQIDLSGYLTKTEAEDTYLTPTGLDQVLYDQSGDEGTTFGSTVADVNNLKDGIKNVYTKTESDSKYQPKGNYLTEHQDISGKANVGDSYTKTESDAKYLTEHQSLTDYAKKSEIPAPYDDTVIKGRIATLEAIDHSQYLTEGALDNVTQSITNTIDQHLQNVTPGLNHIPSGGSEKQVLAYQSNGKAKWETLSNILPGMEDMLSYGVRWTPGQIDPQVERIGNMNLHRTLPIQSEMKGCIYKPKTKELSYWLNENDWRFRKKPIEAWVHFETPTIAVVLDSKSYTQFDFAKGQYVKTKGHIGIITLVSTTSSGIKLTINWEEGSSIYSDIVTAGGLEIGSRLDGYDGEVMVHVPGFYIRSWEGENYNEVRISQTKIDSTWEYQPPCYVGAYRDTILVNKPQDMGYLTELGAVDQRHPISVANYNANCRGGTNDASKDDLDDIFQRDLGKCITGFAREPLRAWTRLSNKEIMSYIQYKNIIYWLYVIEYANFDSQATFTSELDSNGFHQGGLGNGITGVQNWNTFNDGCPICVNGYTNNLGNRSGIKLILSDNINASSLSANRWRGIENPFGDVNTIVDGIISVDGNVYVTNNPEFYTDSASDISNLTFIGTVPETLACMIIEYSLGHTAELVVKHTNGSMKNEGYKSDIIVFGGVSGLSFPIFGGSAQMTYDAGLGSQMWINPSQTNPQNGFRTIVVE